MGRSLCQRMTSPKAKFQTSREGIRTPPNNESLQLHGGILYYIS